MIPLSFIKRNTFLAVFFPLVLYQLISCKLERVVMLTRVGAKNPVGANLLSNKSLTATASISASGAREMVILGKELRRRYVTETHFLSSDYLQAEIGALSSDTVRAYQTAMALLIGLYPPSTGQHLDPALNIDEVIPPWGKSSISSQEIQNLGKFCAEAGLPIFHIGVIHHSSDYYFRAAKPTFCPRLKGIYYSMINTTEFQAVKKFFDEEVYDPFMKAAQPYLSDSSSSVSSIPRVDAVRQIWKNYETNKFHGVLIPNFSEDLVEKVREFESRVIYEVRFANDAVKKISTSKIFSRIIKSFKDAIEGKYLRSEKFLLYSGHRTTFHGVLANLFTKDELMSIQARLPKFGSSIIIELHSLDGISPPQHIVKVLVNDQVIKIAKCMKGDSCQAHDFIAYLKGRIMPKVHKFCRSKN